LSQLPDEEFARIAEALYPVNLTPGFEVSQPNEPIQYIYFPECGLISTDAFTDSGESVEIGVVGREGITGLPALFGQPQMAHRVLVQGSGKGYRIAAPLLRKIFLEGGELQRLINNFIYLQLIQISQSVLCNRLHELETRLARWLMMSADRMESDQLQLTQEFLAQMLGVQRSTVTVAAGVLQRGGMIEYRRGKILILNRAMLKEAACECYHVVDAGFEKLLRRDAAGNLMYV
jgi:CRP-like cAMP-binding protein